MENSASEPGSLRVLLIEDSMPVRQRMRSLIEEFGPGEVVGEGGSVAVALSLYATHRPDAVVLDLFLLDGNSFGVVTEIKRTDPSCVIIVVTNFATPESRKHCAELGVDHFLEKSVEFERVPKILAEVRRAKRDLQR